MPSSFWNSSNVGFKASLFRPLLIISHPCICWVLGVLVGVLCNYLQQLARIHALEFTSRGVGLNSSLVAASAIHNGCENCQEFAQTDGQSLQTRLCLSQKLKYYHWRNRSHHLHSLKLCIVNYAQPSLQPTLSLKPSWIGNARFWLVKKVYNYCQKSV